MIRIMAPSSAGRALRYVPLALIPLSLGLRHGGAAPAVVFAAAAAAIVPLADWIRRATEQIAGRAGSAIGGLLNVTFGNAAELILALFVLAAGNASVVKATITGSIVGNSLLGLGLAILVGGWARERQVFRRERAGLLASLLILSVVALLVPALFDYTERTLRGLPFPREPGRAAEPRRRGGAHRWHTPPTWSTPWSPTATSSPAEDDAKTARPDRAGRSGGSLLVLVAATAAVALEAELVSGALEATARALGPHDRSSSA